MRALDLDFRSTHPWRVRSGVLVLALVCGALGLVGWHERDILASTAVEQATLDAMSDQVLPNKASRRGQDPHVQAEIQSAREVLVHLDLPWERLFGSVESVTGKDVALLGIDPDPTKQTVKISGEAKHYDDVLDYARRLEASGPLYGVYLMNHKIETQDPERPIHFTLGAAWRSGS